MGKWLAACIVALVWILALYAWLSNAILRAIQTPPDFVPLGILLLLFLLVVILYLAEGMEIAFADLRDKDVEQFQDGTTQKLLKEIQKRPEFFFSQRQVFVVAIISFVSILITNKISSLKVFGIGEVTDPVRVAAIHFIFINVLVLCGCQVAPKRLAILNSERFLTQSKWVWSLIKGIGWLNIPGPADWLVPALAKIFGYTKRKLPPSRASHFNSTALIHGYCIDQRSIQLILHPDGSGETELYYLVIFLHGRRQTISGNSRVGPNNLRYISEVNVLGAWKMPSVEDLKEHETILDDIYRRTLEGEKTADLCAAHNLSVIRIDGRHQIRIADKAAPSNEADWTIEFLDEFPESMNSGRTPHQDIVCLLYKAKGKSAAGDFFLGQPDSWSERITTVCRNLSFSVRGSQPAIQVAIQGCEVVLEKAESQLKEEAQRAAISLRERGEIDYLIQSATYNMKWDSMVGC